MHDQPLTPDCLVVGGGMAGIFAALAARSRGLSVLIVEPSNVLGGQGTAGGVAGFCGDTERVNTPFAQLIDKLLAHGHIARYNPRADRREYDLEWCAFYLQEMVADAGVDVLLHAVVVDAQATDGQVTQVRLGSGDGLLDVQPKMVIDATGRCIVPVKAGFETVNEGANRQLPMSLYFTLWDSRQKVEPFLPSGCPQWDDDEDLPMTTLHRFGSGKVEVKMKVIGFDAADPFGISQAEMHARRQMMGLIYYLQTHGYRGQVLDTHVLASVSRHIGVREERRIVGEHLLTETQATHGYIADDAVAVGTYHLDYHWPDKVQRAGTGITTMVEPYHIPLGSLVPKGAKNLLAPGRGASGDQMAMSSFRVMATVAQMGFAAGHAAAACEADATDLTGVNVSALQRQLEADGQSLDLSHYGDYLRQQITTHEHVFEEAPFPACHASTLVQLSNGRFLAAWFAGTAEKDPDVGIWGATRSEGQWSTPRLLVKMNDQAHWNPVLQHHGNGHVQLFFKVGLSAATWETWHIESRDHGWTWGEPIRMANLGPRIRGPVKNKAITLSDGTLLAGSSLELDSGSASWRAFVDRSEDGGQTWQCGEPIAMGDGLPDNAGVIQPTLWESKPGQVHMLLRSNMGYVCRSDSTDAGRSWCPVYATDLPNNNSGLDAALLPDGRLALIYNPVGSDWGARTPLSIALSPDNGRTWTHQLDLETEAGEFSYPALIPTARGLAATYTWNRKRITFWHGSVEQIPAR